MAKYQIQKGRPRLLDEYRGDRIFGDTYNIIKNGNPAYVVTISTLGEMCDCPGFVNHGKCKHLGMVFDYLTEGDKDGLQSDT